MTCNLKQELTLPMSLIILVKWVYLECKITSPPCLFSFTFRVNPCLGNVFTSYFTTFFFFFRSPTKPPSPFRTDSFTVKY